jgi:hypothetical protein
MFERLRQGVWRATLEPSLSAGNLCISRTLSLHQLPAGSYNCPARLLAPSCCARVN